MSGFRAERRAAPKPARVPSGDRPTYSSGEGSTFVEIGWRGRPVRIEHAWLQPERAGASLVVFLHEGLGSVAMWRDFPARLCAALGVRGLVYSRPGYGRSTPREPGERWAPDFMHRQADEVLPALLRALGVPVEREPPWLFGHSDGGSIALLHAARHPVAGAIVLAPHLFVEDVSVASIALARQAYEQGALRGRLARYHDDVDSAFFGWNGIWLDAGFRGWNIEAEVAKIGAPLLAIQGVDDEYGTLAQIRTIHRLRPATRLVELPGCGHSPHRDRPDEVIAAAAGFITGNATPPPTT